MQNETLIRALDVCIQKMQSGEKIEQALELYPQLSADLTPPLEAVQVLRVYNESLSHFASMPSQPREQFINSAEQFNQRTGQDTAARIWITRLTWFVIFFCIIIAGVWLFIATSRALPGDVLYSMKTEYWQARLLLNNDPVQRLIIQRSYDQARLDELLTLTGRGQSAKVEFAGLLEQNDPNNWTVSGIPVTLSSQTQIVGDILNHTWIDVNGTVSEDGTVEANQVRPRQYTLTGILQEIAPDELRVSGVPVKLSTQTIMHGLPEMGNLVTVIALRAADGSLVARLVDVPLPNP